MTDSRQVDRMGLIKQWTNEDGAHGSYHEGRLSIINKPSMTRDDGVVAVGIDAPWIDELAGAVSTLVRIAEMRSYQPGDAADQARQTLTLLGVEPFASARGQ